MVLSFIYNDNLNHKLDIITFIGSLDTTQQLEIACITEKAKKRKGESDETKDQRNRKGVLSILELFLSTLELYLLLSTQLTIVGSKTWSETPMRYRCVRLWHVLQRKHLTCLRAKKLASCTHLSHFLHRNASSAWQYNEALLPQSSQETKREVVLFTLTETSSLKQKPVACWVPLHILEAEYV